MANRNLPDALYQRSREQLLPYEDARMNSLLQAMANFYTTRNDQSTWGNFLRALAIELGKVDYNYSYDIVNKNPSYLTPPDISRVWRDPLYVSSNWPSPTQFDLAFKVMLVELIAAYQEGSTVKGIQDVIFAYTGINIQVQELYKLIGNGVYDQSDRNAIKVSVSVGNNSLSEVTSLTQLQSIVQSLYGAIDLAKPAHVGLEFTTIFGEDEDIDCFISPTFVTQQQFLVLPVNQQAIYTLNAYVLVNPPIFWIASTPTSNPYALDTLLRDPNGNLQLVTTSGRPGGSIPTFNPVSNQQTTDGTITWTNITPPVTNLSLTGNVVTVTMGTAGGFNQALQPGQSVTLINLNSGDGFNFLNGIALTVITSTPTTFTAAFTHANVSSTPQTSGTATYIPPSSINILQFKALTTTLQLLYQQQYTNSACSSIGINDTLRIFIRQVELPPQSPMLIQAPVLDPTNPTTTVSAWGILLSPTLTLAAWAALPSITFSIVNTVANGTNAGYTYSSLTGGTNGVQLHEGMRVTITGTTNGSKTLALTSVSPTLQINNAIYNGTITGGANNAYVGLTFTVTGFTNTSNNGVFLCVASTATTLTLNNPLSVSETHVGSAGNNPFNVTGKIRNVIPAVPAWSIGTAYTTGAIISFANIVWQAQSNNTGQQPGPTSTFWSATDFAPNSGTFQIPLNQTISSAAEGSGHGTATPTLQSAYVLQGGQYVLLQDSSLPPLSDNTLNPPSKWIEVVDQATTQPTGEVANWDITHPAGLVAPRLDKVWEISGGDQDFIFGMS